VSDERDNGNNGNVALQVKMATLIERVEHLRIAIGVLAGTVERELVTKEEFRPIQRVVTGAIRVILLAFLGGLAALVWVGAK
jgi:hypothetical protein